MQERPLLHCASLPHAAPVSPLPASAHDLEDIEQNEFAAAQPTFGSQASPSTERHFPELVEHELLAHSRSSVQV
jgi:hypothetical protein